MIVETEPEMWISMTAREKFDYDSQRIQNNCNKFIENLMREYIDRPDVNVEFKYYHDTDKDVAHRACIWWNGVDKQDGWVLYLGDPIDWYWWSDFVFSAKKDLPKYLAYLSSWTKGFNPDEVVEFDIQHSPPIS